MIKYLFNYLGYNLAILFLNSLNLFSGTNSPNNDHKNSLSSCR
jgi:hypothetical protein